MLKWIAPLFAGMRMAPRPHPFSVNDHSHGSSDRPTRGQRLAERVAASVGSWWFLSAQSGFLVLWLIYNTLQFTRHFDPPPYILLNLLLSFQAAFTGPVLLIAANVGALRDHKQADRIEQLSAQSEAIAEQNSQLVVQVVSLEHMVDEHVAASIRAHTLEIRQLYGLLREVHSVVTGQPATQVAELIGVDPTATVANLSPEGTPDGERADGRAQGSGTGE